MMRRWMAWKFVQLAERIYSSEYCERISIRDKDGINVIEWDIVGDLYGCGVSSQVGPASGEFSGYTVHWEDI